MNSNIINPPAVVREVRSLAEIEADINRESGRLKHTKLRLGRLLFEAKEQVSHGDWSDWVEPVGSIYVRHSDTSPWPKATI